MTPLFRQLQRMQSKGEVIRTGVIGAGFMGRGIVYQLAKMPGMYPSMIVNRTAERAIEAYELAGFNPKHVLVSDDTRMLSQAIFEKRQCVSRSPDIDGAVGALDVVIEAAAAVERGGPDALSCMQ